MTTTQSDLQATWDELCARPELRERLTTWVIFDRNEGRTGTIRKKPSHKRYDADELDAAMAEVGCIADVKLEREPYVQIIGYVRLLQPNFGMAYQERVTNPIDPTSRALARCRAALRALKAREASDVR